MAQKPNSFFGWLGRQIGHVKGAIGKDVTKPTVVYRKETVKESSVPDRPNEIMRRTVIDEVVPPAGKEVMKRMLKIVIRDFFGLARVCGILVALRWLLSIALNFGKCASARNLQPADLGMGKGPFTARLRDARAKLYGEQVISGVREIWVRDVYLDGGRLEIPSDGVVVDLGANMGNFTVLALGHGPGVRCISVEGNPRMVPKLRENIAANGWEDRSEICTQFIGGTTRVQEQLQQETGGAEASRFISEADFVEKYRLTKIDFLKCDIEGSEFGLLHPESLLLGMAKQVALELHKWGGDVHQFIAMLREQGFDVHVASEDAEGAIVQAKRSIRAGDSASARARGNVAASA